MTANKRPAVLVVVEVNPRHVPMRRIGFFLNKNEVEKDCDWFANDADVRCEKHGEKEGEFDLTANQACCACGGGDLPRQCTDEDDWYVSHHNDKDYNCDWFAKDPDTRCEKHGNRVGKYDMTADEISSV